MKTYVITLSKTFPKGHIRAGEPTDFTEQYEIYEEGSGRIIDTAEKLNPRKIHTIRANYDLWAKRFEDIERGEGAAVVHPPRLAA